MKDFLLLNIFVVTYIINCVCAGEQALAVKKLEEENGDEDWTKESLAVADPQNQTKCTRRQESSMHAIRNAEPGQFPFVVAVMSQKDDYLCTGTIVSDGLILTTAECASKAVGYVLLNATRDKKEEHTHSYAVIEVEKFFTHAGPNPAKDVAFLHTERFNSSHDDYRIKISNFTIPQDIHDIEAFGYGLNAEVGQPKELQYVGLEVREPFNSIFLYAYFDCVDTKVLTCFKDTGGPVIVVDELIGVVRNGQDKCTTEMSSQYMINKNMVEIMPVFLYRTWLNEGIQKNEEQATNAVMKASGRRASLEAGGALGNDGKTKKENGTITPTSDLQKHINHAGRQNKLDKTYIDASRHSKGRSGAIKLVINFILFSLPVVILF